MTFQITIDQRIFRPIGILASICLILWGAIALAAPGDPVPNSFQPGDPVSSAKLNANFAEHTAQIGLLGQSSGAPAIRWLEVEATAFGVGDVSAKARCDADEVLISGGCLSNSNNVIMYASNPDREAADPGYTRWRCALTHTHPSQTIRLYAYAGCQKKAP